MCCVNTYLPENLADDLELVSIDCVIRGQPLHIAQSQNNKFRVLGFNSKQPRLKCFIEISERISNSRICLCPRISYLTKLPAVVSRIKEDSNIINLNYSIKPNQVETVRADSNRKFGNQHSGKLVCTYPHTQRSHGFLGFSFQLLLSKTATLIEGVYEAP